MTSNVDRLTADLRRMAANFEIKPEERIREGAMAKQLAVSRTPLREALNRLVSEGYLTYTPGQGFFCRALTPDRILDLYEARMAVECEGLRLAHARATSADIQQVAASLDGQLPDYDQTTDRLQLLAMDEAFHMALIGLSANRELVQMLDNINGRIRYVRMIGLKMQPEGASRLLDHRQIVDALAARDLPAASAMLRSHIELRKDDATRAVQTAFSQMYVRTG